MTYNKWIAFVLIPISVISTVIVIDNMFGFVNKHTKSDTAYAAHLLKQPISVSKEIPGTVKCSVEETWRFECSPDAGKTKIDCLKRGCCWTPSRSPNIPKCFYPSNFTTYHVQTRKATAWGETLHLSGITGRMRGSDIRQLRVDVIHETRSRLHIKICDPINKRWEVPLKTPTVKKSSRSTDYVVEVVEPFSIIVRRKSSGVTIMNTSVGALVFADQFLQLSSTLPSALIYGLGQHRDRLLHSVNWTRFTMWNKDTHIRENTNLYGSHPFYMAMDGPGHFHGVFLLNSNAMEAVLQPAPAITWRTIGGILDFYIFLGAEPASVVQQYTDVVGRSFMPPYWGLGYHLCRWGYKTANRTYEIVQRNMAAGVPLEVQWNDLEYSDKQRDFTYDPKTFGNLPYLVRKIHDLDMHYVMMFDPGISNKYPSYEPYDLGLRMDIFIKNQSGDPLVGKVWPGTTVFPDFTNPRTAIYWRELITKFHGIVPFDGMWIDMNEISNFVIGSVDGCPKSSTFENPPYVPTGLRGGLLRYFTLCASARQFWSLHYDVHNLYGLTEANATYHALTGVREKRPFIISRSTFSGIGQWSGHWSGDNRATFHDLRASISASLTMNMLGVSVVGADICGFLNNTSEELCARWHQLGAFYPFMRNHNDRQNIPQDPAAFERGITATIANAISIRYCLLPYIYTLVFKSHVFGKTVIRPMFFEWPFNKDVRSLDTQFMVGPALLFVPVTDKHSEFVDNSTGRYYTSLYKAYFPEGQWYQYLCPSNNVDRETITGGGGWTVLTSHLSTNEAVVSPMPVYVRQGFIVPSFYNHAATATKTRLAPFTLTIVLNETLRASGDIYWDDGDTLDTYEKRKYNYISFSVVNNCLTSTVEHYGYKSAAMSLVQLRIFEIHARPKSISVNGVTFLAWDYNLGQREVMMNTTGLLALVDNFNVAWSF